jgi:hypothetical protein
MEMSQFAHGPDDDGMVTMYHMDGEHLMLTHYCMAKNQPRMRATEISEDGKSVIFTFLDGTNLPSRDKGHMDKAVFHFDGPDAMRSQWTFYANGKEQWMEEITYTAGSAPPLDLGDATFTTRGSQRDEPPRPFRDPCTRPRQSDRVLREDAGWKFAKWNGPEQYWLIDNRRREQAGH